MFSHVKFYLSICFYDSPITSFLNFSHATCQDLVQTVDQDEEGHKILKQAKEESDTIYTQFETALNGMQEALKACGEKVTPAPKTPAAPTQGGHNSPKKP